MSVYGSNLLNAAVNRKVLKHSVSLSQNITIAYELSFMGQIASYCWCDHSESMSFIYHSTFQLWMRMKLVDSSGRSLLITDVFLYKTLTDSC